MSEEIIIDEESIEALIKEELENELTELEELEVERQRWKYSKENNASEV